MDRISEDAGGGLVQEDLQSFIDLAGSFTRKEILPIFDEESSDGDLSMVPGILDKAFETGLASSPDRGMPGSEYGIWGASADSSGMTSSMALLSKIAEVCGGLAMCLHSQGIASNILMQSSKRSSFTPVRAALCLQEGYGLPGWGTILSPDLDLPEKISTRTELTGREYTIDGFKSFVYSIDRTDAYAVFARIKDKWSCLMVPSDAPGLSKEDAGVRTGLRACGLYHIKFEKVRVPSEFRIDDGDAMNLFFRTMCINWLGLSAIAAGIAKGAVSSAKKYTSERYQGGKIIQEHPAIKMLIADSEARMKLSEDGLLSHRFLGKDLKQSLKNSAMTKLSVLELCSRAVTDCLQTFGGYGYMDDFGMSKRLRDITVLKSASGSPNYLKQLIFDIDK